MVDEEKKPFGYIYQATNQINGKYYIGQTGTDRWRDEKIPIQERWKEEVREAYAKKRRGEDLRYVENAIIKYGPENFSLKELDKSYSQEELNAKERHYIKEYDSMNRNKGYNMNEGGLGGRPSEEVREKLSKIGSEKWDKDSEYRDKQIQERKERAKDPEFIEKMTQINREKGLNPQFRETVSKSIAAKYQEDPEYKAKQTNERKERAKDPEFIEKMTKINRERAKDPEYRQKMSGITKERAKDPDWRKKLSDRGKEVWKNPEFIQKQIDAHDKLKKKIEDKGEFLNEVKNQVPKKDLNEKYGMDGKTLNRRIKEILGEKGVKNYTELKDYLQDKNVEDVVKDIEKQSDKKQESPSEQSNEEKKEEKPEDLKEEVDKDEKPSEAISERKGKETGEKLGKGKEFGMKLKSVREKDTHRQRPKETRAKEGGTKTPILTSGIRQKQPVQRGSKDYDGIDRAPSRKWIDYKGIDLNLDSSGDDIKGLGGGKNDKERDFEGIDKLQERKTKDYVKLEDNYGEGRYEGRWLVLVISK